MIFSTDVSFDDEFGAEFDTDTVDEDISLGHEFIEEYANQVSKLFKKHVFLNKNSNTIFFFNSSYAKIRESFLKRTMIKYPSQSQKEFISEIIYSTEYLNEQKLLHTCLSRNISDYLKDAWFAEWFFENWFEIFTDQTYKNIDGNFEYISEPISNITIFSEKNSKKFLSKSNSSGIILT